MNFNSENARKRLFAPRIVIYIILAVAAAWLMHRYEGYGKVDKAASQPQQELSEIVPQTDKRLPVMLFILDSEDNAQTRIIEEANEKLAGKCIVMKLTAPPQELKTVFKVGKMPSIILCDSANKEIGRVDGALAWEQLLEQVPEI